MRHRIGRRCTGTSPHRTCAASTTSPSTPGKVEKPWGWELIWALTDAYAGKILFVPAGESLSLQFHNVKDESWYVLEGGPGSSSAERGTAMLDEVVSQPGRRSTSGPGTVAPRHRARGHADPRGLDARTSTTSSGSRTGYGREGTSRTLT